MNKQILLTLLMFVSLMACRNEDTTTSNDSIEVENGVDVYDWSKNASIYEVNIRQHTPEGTFKAFLPHLTKIKALGTDILWFMPIHPIGEKNRKGKMGSYYSIQDYTAVNPDFGTLEDFKLVVDSAHALGFKVIMDWVANHTSWDHEWTKTNPEFYSKDSLGNSPIVPPTTDWTDVADLNYDNEDLHEAMIKEMQFWLQEADVDGFRCDVAGFVPMEFWNKARPALDSVKPVFMLAEWDEPEMHEAFHMTYGWGFHHLLNDIVKEGSPKSKIMEFFEKENERYADTAYRMFFITNHDENSWNKNVFERFGELVDPFAVFAFTVKGMPLVYSGQEAGLNKDLRFFDKDTIDWDSNVKYRTFYQKLLQLHEETEALWNGKFGVQAKFLESTENVIAYERIKDGKGIRVYINMGSNVAKEKVENEKMEVYMKTEGLKVSQGEIVLPPNSYVIFLTQ